ncbi:MAG: transporter substrate-binding domain-containing protein [Acidisphaera sp.]|nr:transporter substrate-binding domain-containing protein [Acidisphaera sp.]
MRSLRGLLGVVAITWLLAVPPAMAQTSSGLDAILARGTLRVGLTGDYKPFSFRDPQSGTFSGLDVDLAQSLAAAMGVKLEIVPTAWSTLLADLTSGKYDIGMGGITINLTRAKTAFFSSPVMRAGKTPIARCADRDRFQTLAQIDRPEVTVITNPGGTNESFDRANLHAAKILVFPDNATIFDQLVQGHADLMITDGVETRLQQKLHPELCAIHPDQPFNVSELGYMLPRDLPLKLFVDEWLRELDETGEHARMNAKWLG